MQLSNIPLEILKNAKDDVTLIRDAFRNNTCKDLVTITKEEEEDVRMNVLACKDAFPVLTIENYFNEDFLDSVKDELLDCEFYQKSNDLYEFVQTEDLNKMMEGTLKTLYSHLCSTEFTEFISALTGIELLESRLNMAGQIYSQGGYLECHDDDIHQSGEDSNSVVGRRIAFIIYLCDERWDSKKQGGELQLLKVNEKDGSASLEVAASLVPKWNRIALFEVTPYSYHRVSEVLSDEHLRVSLTGWFYGPLAEFTSCPEVVVESKQECFEFTQDNKISLEWINKVYRNKKNIKKMQKVFGEESCIELQGFLDGKIHLELLKNIKESECVEKGPANVQSLLEITPNSVLKEFQEKLTSDSFRLWLQDIAYFEPASICFEWKQFRGGDYTLCHDSMEKGECLELVYYFSGTMEPESGGDLVYMSQDEHLLSICPSDNKLVIIYKEEGVMGFVKRLSRQRNTQEDLIMLVCRITIKSEEESSEEGER